MTECIDGIPDPNINGACVAPMVYAHACMQSAHACCLVHITAAWSGSSSPL